MSQFNTQQINDIQNTTARNSEYGVSIAGLWKIALGIGKAPSKSGKWGKFANINAKATKETGNTINKIAFKACGYSGFNVLIDGQFVPLTAENCNVSGLPVMPCENGQGDAMTHSAGTTSSIMHILEATLTADEFDKVCELTAIIENTGITKFGQNKVKIEPKQAVAANNKPGVKKVSKAILNKLTKAEVIELFGE